MDWQILSLTKKLKIFKYQKVIPLGMTDFNNGFLIRWKNIR